MGFGSDDSYLLVSRWDYHLWLNINLVWDSVSMIFILCLGGDTVWEIIEAESKMGLSLIYPTCIWNISMDLFMHTLHQVWI